MMSSSFIRDGKYQKLLQMFKTYEAQKAILTSLVFKCPQRSQSCLEGLHVDKHDVCLQILFQGSAVFCQASKKCSLPRKKILARPNSTCDK